MQNSNSKKYLRIAMFSLLFLTSALILILYFSYVRIRQQYENFTAFEESNLYPKFDELNYLIYQDLPIPAGVREIERYASGGIPQHGRELVVFYKYSNTSIENIASFYTSFLTQSHWMIDRDFDDMGIIRLFYRKDTACLYLYLDRGIDKYHVKIFHDYYKQNFSLKLEDMPPMDYIHFREFGETFFEECPRPDS
jgi:hypothetical protein